MLQQVKVVSLYGRYDELDQIDTSAKCAAQIEEYQSGASAQEVTRQIVQAAGQFDPLGLSGHFVATGIGYKEEDRPVTILVTPSMSAFNLMQQVVEAWYVNEGASSHWPSNWYWFVSVAINPNNNTLSFIIE